MTDPLLAYAPSDPTKPPKHGAVREYQGYLYRYCCPCHLWRLIGEKAEAIRVLSAGRGHCFECGAGFMSMGEYVR